MSTVDHELQSLEQWLRSSGSNRTSQWKTKLKNAVQATFGNLEGQSWLYKRRRSFLQPLRVQTPPLLFLACCCTFSQMLLNELGLKGKDNTTIIKQILSFKNLDGFMIPDDIQEYLNDLYKEVPNSSLASFIQSLADGNNTTLSKASIVATIARDRIHHRSTPASIQERLNAVCKVTTIPKTVPMLHDINPEEWQPYCRIPEVYDSKDCWTDPQSQESIFDSLIDSINREPGPTYLIEHHPTSAAEALRRMIKPSTESVLIENIPTSNNPALTFPHSDRRQIPLTTPTRPSNWSSQGTIVEFHIDGGMEGLTATIGDAVKLWFLAPPTPNNLRTALNSKHQVSPTDYEGCVMTVTTSQEVIYLPAGCLHATVTLTTGYVTGVCFVDQYTILGAASSFEYTLMKDTGVYLEDDFNVLCSALDTACASGHLYKIEAQKVWNEKLIPLKIAIEGQSSAQMKRWNDRPWERLLAVAERHGLVDTASTGKKRRPVHTVWGERKRGKH